MKEILSAFCLGLLFFFLLFLVGEGLGLELPDFVAVLLMFVLSAAYFFICQFFLSRGNPHAFPKDWPVMLALDAVWIISFIIMILVEKRGAILGDNRKALGPLQIHRAYHADARIGGDYSRCADLDYSKRVVTAYLQRYAPAAWAAGDVTTLARVHNGGPREASKQVTVAYGDKVARLAK